MVEQKTECARDEHNDHALDFRAGQSTHDQTLLIEYLIDNSWLLISANKYVIKPRGITSSLRQKRLILGKSAMLCTTRANVRSVQLLTKNINN